MELNAAAAGSDSDAYAYVIAANDGRVLMRNNLRTDAQGGATPAGGFRYRVFATDDGFPLDSPEGDNTPSLSAKPDGWLPTTVAAPALVNTSQGAFSKQDPWLTEGANTLSGNNAHAYADLQAPDGFSDGDLAVDAT